MVWYGVVRYGEFSAKIRGVEGKGTKSRVGVFTPVWAGEEAKSYHDGMVSPRAFMRSS